jgi:hypothetical protein
MVHPRRRRPHLHCCETLRSCTVHIYWEATVHHVQRFEKLQIKKAKCLVPCPYSDAGTNLTPPSHRIQISLLHFDDPTEVYTHRFREL